MNTKEEVMGTLSSVASTRVHQQVKSNPNIEEKNIFVFADEKAVSG